MKISPALAYFLVTLTAASWAGSIVIGRAVFDDAGPMTLTFWRWFIGFLVLLPFVVNRMVKNFPEIWAARWVILSLGAFVGIATGLTLLAVNFTTATNASLVNGAQPIASIAIASIVFRDRLTWVQGLGILAAALGIILTIVRGELEVLLSLQFNIGDLIMIAAVTGYGLYANYLRKMPVTIDPWAGLGAIMFGTSVALLPFYIGEIAVGGSGVFNQDVILAILFLAIAASTLAMVFWNAALGSVGVARAAIFVALVPIFGAGFAVFFLGEELFLFHAVGTALVCLGIALVVHGHKKPNAA